MIPARGEKREKREKWREQSGSKTGRSLRRGKKGLWCVLINYFTLACALIQDDYSVLYAPRFLGASGCHVPGLCLHLILALFLVVGGEFYFFALWNSRLFLTLPFHEELWLNQYTFPLWVCILHNSSSSTVHLSRGSITLNPFYPPTLSLLYSL